MILSPPRAGAVAVMGAVAALAAIHTAHAQPPPPGDARLAGYLTARQLADPIKFLGPPPDAASGAKAGDVQTFEATRRLEGTPRWALATRDDSVGAIPMMANFSCAVGTIMTPQSAPALLHLFTRLVSDTGLAIGPAKDFYKRPRPFIEKGGKVCIGDLVLPFGPLDLWLAHRPGDGAGRAGPGHRCPRPGAQLWREPRGVRGSL